MPSAKTVDDMMISLPKNEMAITARLRELVSECLPLATEKPYYGLGVPYYSRHRQICYIFPSSALYGTEGRREETPNVTLGFCQGNKMSNEDGLLKSEGRKQVRVLYFHSIGDINEENLRALLFEAAMIDDSFKKKANKK